MIASYHAALGHPEWAVNRSRAIERRTEQKETTPEDSYSSLYSVSRSGARRSTCDFKPPLRLQRKAHVQCVAVAHVMRVRVLPTDAIAAQGQALAVAMVKMEVWGELRIMSTSSITGTNPSNLQN